MLVALWRAQLSQSSGNQNKHKKLSQNLISQVVENLNKQSFLYIFVTMSIIINELELVTGGLTCFDAEMTLTLD